MSTDHSVLSMILINNWILMAFIAVVMWSIVNLIDVYFSQEVFKSPYDGVMVSGLFQGLFCFAPLLHFTPFIYNGLLPLVLGILSGVCFQLACLFYLKALFARGDVIMMQILWNINMALVPILSLFLLFQTRSPMQIVGSIIVIMGSMLFSLDSYKRGESMKSPLIYMLIAMTMFSLCKVGESAIYSNLSTEFWTGYLYFSMGNLLVALISLIFKKSDLSIFYANFSKFAVAEGLSLLATISSARAILVSGTASSVVLVEGFTPVVTLILTYCLMFIGYLFAKDHGLFKKSMLAMQVNRVFVKLIAILTMSAGFYLTLL